MTKQKHKITLFLASALLAGSLSLSGQVFLTGDVVVGTGEFTISSDLNFTVGLSGDAQALVFKNWGVPADSGIDGAQLLSDLSFSIDGGATQTVSGGAVLYDNFVGIAEDVEPTDAFLYFETVVPITVGQTITFFSDTWSLASTGGSPMGPGDGWNTAVSGAYGGEVFLMSATGTSLSNTIEVAVPEPSAFGMLIGSLALASAMVRRRRRKGSNV